MWSNKIVLLVDGIEFAAVKVLMALRQSIY